MVFGKNGRQPFLKHKVGNITIKTCKMNTLILVEHLLSQTHLKLPENNYKRKQVKQCSLS